MGVIPERHHHELVPMTIDKIIHWIEGDSVGEKTCR